MDQALALLAHAGWLMRICQGVYMRPVETRFGSCPPRISTAHFGMPFRRVLPPRRRMRSRPIPGMLIRSPLKRTSSWTVKDADPRRDLNPGNPSRQKAEDQASVRCSWK